MYRFIVTLVVLNVVADANPSFNRNLPAGRIINGVHTSIQQHPYQVSLQRWYKHFCGGSLIAKDIVVTAAHCVKDEDISSLQVRVGSTLADNGGELINVKNYKYHEKYTGSGMKYDVAVLQLERSVNQSSTVRYIQLADSLPETGTPAVVTGWGLTCVAGCDLSKILMEVEVSFLNREECASNDYFYGNAVTETMVCAYTQTKDSCQGDSGGPLVVGSKLVGIVSWGNGCAKEGFPGVYSDVVALREWILHNAQKF